MPPFSYTSVPFSSLPDYTYRDYFQTSVPRIMTAPSYKELYSPLTAQPKTWGLNFRYLLTLWSRAFLENLTGFQLVKKFPTFYGTRRFITAVTSARHLDHNPTSYFLKFHLHIILPSTSWSTKWSLSFRFPHQNPLHASHLPHTRYMPRPSHSSRFYHISLLCLNINVLPI